MLRAGQHLSIYFDLFPLSSVAAITFVVCSCISGSGGGFRLVLSSHPHTECSFMQDVALSFPCQPHGFQRVDVFGTAVPGPQRGRLHGSVSSSPEQSRPWAGRVCVWPSAPASGRWGGRDGDGDGTGLLELKRGAWKEAADFQGRPLFSLTLLSSSCKSERLIRCLVYSSLGRSFCWFQDTVQQKRSKSVSDG